jgi:hypothetical protein
MGQYRMQLRGVVPVQVVSRIQAETLEQARAYFQQRKAISEQQFDQLWEVQVDTPDAPKQTRNKPPSIN